MVKSDSTFAARLAEAFEYLGITDPKEKIARLAAVTGRKPRTVARWLSGDSVPRTDSPSIHIARDLRVSIDWLVFGLGHSPSQQDLLERLSTMPPGYAPKLTRYMLRLMNGDPKALRWTAMFERGELSGLQVLDMA